MPGKFFSRGQQGEELACQYLQSQGMRCLTKNWRCKLGEIDLIMTDTTTRVLVEVRLRSPTSFGLGYETVGYQKQQKLIRTAQVYQQKENYWGDIRFDVVSITWDKEVVIEHIKDAFGI